MTPLCAKEVLLGARLKPSGEKSIPAFYIFNKLTNGNYYDAQPNRQTEGRDEIHRGLV